MKKICVPVPYCSKPKSLPIQKWDFEKKHLLFWYYLHLNFNRLLPRLRGTLFTTLAVRNRHLAFDLDSSRSTIIIIVVNVVTCLLLPLLLLALIMLLTTRRGTLPRCDLPPHTSTPSSLLRLNLNHVQSQLQSQSSWYYQDSDYENSVFNPILPSILFWKCTVKPIQPV